MTTTAWIIQHWGVIATFLWALCELLNQIPAIKASTVLELIVTGIRDAVKGQAVKPAVTTVTPIAPSVTVTTSTPPSSNG